MIFNRFFNKKITDKIANFAILHNYFFILVGFLGGNLCGSLFILLSLSPVLIILSIVFFLEFLSYIYYRIANQVFFFKVKRLKNLKFLYLIKVGFVFGIFVDAFKVGS